jgi:membrane-associated protease RseP (regulator of RpoE activity)
MGLGFMNLSFGQKNVNIESISVKKFNAEGHSEKFNLRGEQAKAFDVANYIMENKDADRIFIYGTKKTNLSTTIIKFDSQKQEEDAGDYICKDVVSKQTPFLGVYGTGKRDKTGVNVQRIIPTTAADQAGMTGGTEITQFNGKDIHDFRELQKAVLATTIGDQVDIQIESTTRSYTQDVIMGSRGVETITYKYCDVEPTPLAVENREGNNEVSFTAFPNPTTSTSQVIFNSTSDAEVIFSVTDMTGRTIHKESFTNFDGNLRLDHSFDSNQTGTYILHIQQGNEVYNRKVQVIRD